MELCRAPRVFLAPMEDFPSRQQLPPKQSNTLILVDSSKEESEQVESAAKRRKLTMTSLESSYPAEASEINKDEKVASTKESSENDEAVLKKPIITTSELWKPPKILRDTDRQLPYLLMFEKENKKFYDTSSIMEKDSPKLDITKLPSVKKILDKMKRKTLNGVVIKYTGVKEHCFMPELEKTDLGKAVCALGGQILQKKDDCFNATHLIVTKELPTSTTEMISTTKLSTDASTMSEDKIDTNQNIAFTTHLMWLEAALYTLQKPKESLFQPSNCNAEFRVFWDALEPLPVIYPYNSFHSTDEVFDDMEELLFSNVPIKVPKN